MRHEMIKIELIPKKTIKTGDDHDPGKIKMILDEM